MRSERVPELKQGTEITFDKQLFNIDPPLEPQVKQFPDFKFAKWLRHVFPKCHYSTAQSEIYIIDTNRAEISPDRNSAYNFLFKFLNEQID